MNVTEINPDGSGKLHQYIAAAISLTVITVWLIIAYQIQIREPAPCSADSEDTYEPLQYTYFAFGGGGGGDDERPFKHLNFRDRLLWPVVLASTLIERRKKLKEMRAKTGRDTNKLAQFCQ